MRDNVAFPNGMVDRITPATTDRERGDPRDEFGIEDNWPVFCEDFMQWVLEDTFPRRPAGAARRSASQFVTDVTPFELMKIRILNGGHAIIAYPAGLMDIHFVHEGMADPLVRGFLAKVEREEIIPIVPPVPGTDLDDYFQLIEQRFSNPKIGDTIRRLCLDGSNRQPKFIIPSIADRLERRPAASTAWRWNRRSGAATAPAPPTAARYRAQRPELGPAAGPGRGARKDRPAAWLAMERHLRRRRPTRRPSATPSPARSATLWAERHARDADALSRRRALSVDAVRP